MSHHVNNGTLPIFVRGTEYTLTLKGRNFNPDITYTATINDLSGRAQWSSPTEVKVVDFHTMTVKATLNSLKQRKKGGGRGTILSGAGEGDLTISVLDNANNDSTSSQDVFYQV
jgi:hypothetical protein